MTLALADKRGIKSIAWSYVGTWPGDEDHEDPDFALSGTPLGSTATIVLPSVSGSDGAAYGVRCTVTDEANQATTATAGIYVQANSGSYPGFPGETTEWDEKGWATRINMGVTVDLPTVSAKDFGAVGDGVADDSSALQQAISTAQSNKGVLILEAGLYKLTSTLAITDTVRIQGPRSAILYQTGNNIHVMRVNAATDVHLEGFTLRGNKTGLGGPASAGNTGGHGLALHNTVRFQGVSLAFEDFGIPVEDSEHGNYASPIQGTGNDHAFFDRCYFAEGNHNRTGADILVAGEDVRAVNCVSESDCDTAWSLSGGGDKLTVSNCTAKRLPGTFARSGILVEYGERKTKAIITGNHVEGFAWHGIYPTTGSSVPSDNYGGHIIQGNQVWFCGGGRPGDTSFITAGIRTQGTLGSEIGGNIVAFTGYDADMNPRGVLECPGIMLFEGTTNAHIHHNTIRDGYEVGIAVRALNTGAWIRNSLIDHNTIAGNLGHGILINPQVTNAVAIEGLIIDRNFIDCPTQGKSGITLDVDNGSWANSVDMTFNNVEHTNPPGSGDVPGIYRDGYSDYTRNTGKVIGNTVKGFRTGISIPSTVTLYSPFAVRVSDNVIEDANLGMGLGGGSLYWGLHENTTGRNVTTMQTSRTRGGRILGPYGAGRVNVEVYQLNLINAVPPDGAWTVGDRVFMQAKAGPITGYECVTAGSVGTWRPIYNYGQGGSFFSCKATPILGSSTITVDGMSAWTATGTATSASYANTNRYTRMSRVEYLDTSAGTDSVAAFQNQDLVWLLNTPFYVRFQWGLATGVSISTGRAFCGLVASTSAPTDVDPSTLVNMVGMGWDDDDTNVQLMHNDGSGAAVKVDLGSSFAVPTSDGTQVYTLEMISMGSGTGIQYAVTNETAGVLVRGSFNTEIPNGGTTPLAPQLWSSVGGTSGVTGIAFGGFYGERAY